MPKRREQDEHGIFEPLLPFALDVVERHGDGGGRADQRQDFQKPGEIIDHEAAAETHELARGQYEKDDADDRKQHDGGKIDHFGGQVAAEDAEHEQRHGAEAEQDFRQQRHIGGHVGRDHRLTSLPPPFARRGARADNCR